MGAPCTSSAYPSQEIHGAKPDDLGARERRVFGGVEGEGEDEDLKGRMLDVVVALFKGVDDDGLD